jgi:DNA-binding CsgD family transcriptional regulator
MFDKADQARALSEVQLNFVEFQRWRFRSLGLTDRQLECLEWVQEGKSSGDIGAILGISAKTVDHHILGACQRLGVRTRVQAVVKARELGLIRPAGVIALSGPQGRS